MRPKPSKEATRTSNEDPSSISSSREAASRKLGLLAPMTPIAEAALTQMEAFDRAKPDRVL